MITNAQPGSQVVYLVSSRDDEGIEVRHPIAPVRTSLVGYRMLLSAAVDDAGEHSFSVTTPGSLSSGTTC